MSRNTTRHCGALATFQHHFASMILAAVCFTAVAPNANADDSYIRICNRGDTTVWVALGTNMGLWSGLQVQGWWKYEPGNTNIFGGCTAFSTDEGNGFYLGFAVQDRNGRMTPVVLPPSRGEREFKSTSVAACVPLRGFDKRISWDDTSPTNCGSGELRLQFSAEIDTFDYGNDKEFDIEYTVRPSAPKEDWTSRRSRPNEQVAPSAPRPEPSKFHKSLVGKMVSICDDPTPAKSVDAKVASSFFKLVSETQMEWYVYGVRGFESGTISEIPSSMTWRVADGDKRVCFGFQCFDVVAVGRDNISLKDGDSGRIFENVLSDISLEEGVRRCDTINERREGRVPLYPELPGQWEDQDLRRAEVSASGYAALLNRKVELDWIRTIPLPFYSKNGRKVVLFEGREKKSRNAIYVVAELGSDRRYWLNGTGKPFREMNRDFSIALYSEKEIVSYLKFFNAFLATEAGVFTVVDPASSFLPESLYRQYDLGEITVESTEGAWLITHHMIHGGSLFWVRSKVDESGNVEILEDTRLGPVDTSHFVAMWGGVRSWDTLKGDQ